MFPLAMDYLVVTCGGLPFGMAVTTGNVVDACRWCLGGALLGSSQRSRLQLQLQGRRVARLRSRGHTEAGRRHGRDLISQPLHLNQHPGGNSVEVQCNIKRAALALVSPLTMEPICFLCLSEWP